MHERRAAPRQPVDTKGNVMLRMGAKVPFQVLDRSAGGMRIRTPYVLSVPDRFCAVLPELGEVVWANVVWRRRDEFGLRVELGHFAQGRA